MFPFVNATTRQHSWLRDEELMSVTSVYPTAIKSPDRPVDSLTAYCNYGGLRLRSSADGAATAVLIGRLLTWHDQSMCSTQTNKNQMSKRNFTARCYATVVCVSAGVDRHAVNCVRFCFWRCDFHHHHLYSSKTQYKSSGRELWTGQVRQQHL